MAVSDPGTDVGSPPHPFVAPVPRGRLVVAGALLRRVMVGVWNRHVRDTARRCERWRFTREHEDRWRKRHTDGDPAIRTQGESGRSLKRSPCQRIKDEEEKVTETAQLTMRPSDPEDLLQLL